jgi:RimJ/RimL family protein N-acetyltransferase
MKLELNIEKEIIDDNIKLRKIHKKDKKFLYKNLRNEKVIKHISIGPLKSLRHSKKLIKKYLKRWKSFKEFVYIIEIAKNSNEFKSIGSLSLWNISWKHRRGELGIWLTPKFWNEGIASRALTIITDYAFKKLNLHRLEAHIISLNKNSLYLFRNCEFKEEGVLQDYLNIRDKYYVSYIFSKINKKK